MLTKFLTVFYIYSNEESELPQVNGNDLTLISFELFCFRFKNPILKNKSSGIEIVPRCITDCCHHIIN